MQLDWGTFDKNIINSQWNQQPPVNPSLQKKAGKWGSRSAPPNLCDTTDVPPPEMSDHTARAALLWYGTAEGERAWHRHANQASSALLRQADDGIRLFLCVCSATPSRGKDKGIYSFHNSHWSSLPPKRQKHNSLQPFRYRVSVQMLAYLFI